MRVRVRVRVGLLCRACVAAANCASSRSCCEGLAGGGGAAGAVSWVRVKVRDRVRVRRAWLAEVELQEPRAR